MNMKNCECTAFCYGKPGETVGCKLAAETPIEIVCSALRVVSPAHQFRIAVDEILVPEQCAIVFIKGKFYHITCEEVKS